MLRDMVFWNWPIQFFNDSFIVIVINSLINIKYASWEVEEAAINTGISYALLVLACIYPVLMQAFLYKRRDLLTKYSFLRRFGSAYKGLDERENRFVLYPLFSYYRRLLVILSIIMLPNNFIVQYFAFAFSGMAIVFLLGYQRPFKEVSQNRAALSDEVFIMFYMYHIFCFTEFVPDEATQNGVGYSAITCMLLQMLCFYVVHAFLSTKRLTKYFRRKYALKSAKKQA